MYALGNGTSEFYAPAKRLTTKEVQVLVRTGTAEQEAQRYRVLTATPLGVTDEIAEFECARLLSLELADARQAECDTIRIQNGKRQRLQIKGRCVLSGSRSSQRLGKIDIGKPFDSVLWC